MDRTATSHLSSLISHLSSLIFHLSSLISHLSSLISHLSSLISHLSSLISHLSSLISHLSSLISHLSSLISHLSSLISHLSSLISHHFFVIRIFQLPGHFNVPRFADHGHFDFTGVRQLLLEGLHDIVADLGGDLVAGFLGIDQNAKFAAGLDGIGLLHAREAAGDPLEFLHSLDVTLQALAACTG